MFSLSYLLKKHNRGISPHFTQLQCQQVHLIYLYNFLLFLVRHMGLSRMHLIPMKRCKMSQMSHISQMSVYSCEQLPKEALVSNSGAEF